ncbi:MAG: protein kinase [Rhodothermales bacterium]|nr:protein kinase [Rhodothermales bacterium]
MIGKTVAQYEIIEQLGAGGMGVVYKARDTKLDRIVALKFLPVAVSTDAAVKERFIQEAKAASSLDDPYICTIHDVAEAEDGQLFIVMAFYDGNTLKYTIDDMTMSAAEACSIARQMALGLGAAHDAGIVHRDVKPANVMVTSKGRVKLLDFGVAKLGESSMLTREGSTIGTAAYMSPEQARGESVDSRSDIWSIGVVLYEMLSGGRPFGGPYEAAIAYSILNEEPAPLTDVPEEIVNIVSKALSKDVDTRYQSAVEMANDLAEFSGDAVLQTAIRPSVGRSNAAVPGLQGIVLRFCIGAAVVLGVLYATMIAFGLPGWVFPAGVLLALVGLPIVLYGASLDRKRASLNTGERQKLTGLRAWLTTKRAYQGGILAGAGLIAVVLGFVGLRTAGVGPFATLISGGTLSEQDLLIVADFHNQTTDPTLGLTVTEAFRIDLSQSTAIRLMDRSAVQSALQRMEINPDTTLTSSLALQLAEREGAKGIIEGDINAAGAGFILNARIMSGVDGSQLAAYRESARSDVDILDAIDRLSAKLREEIGESLVNIRSGEALSQVTTSNTEALRLFTEADEVASAGRFEDALGLIRRVIAMDSNFAMAYRKKAVLHSNLGDRDDSSKAAITKAYGLRDQLPLRERLLAEAYYASEVTEDRDEVTRLYEEVLRRYPYDRVALNNVTLEYRRQKRHEESIPLLRRALEVENASVFRRNLVINYAALGRLDDAEHELQEFEANIPGLSSSADLFGLTAYLKDDYELAEAWTDSMAARAVGIPEEMGALERKNHLLRARGRIADARPYRDKLRAMRRERFASPDQDPLKRKGDSLGGVMGYEHQVALMTGDTRRWKAAFDEGLSFAEENNLIEDDDDPYAWFAMTHVTLGFHKEALPWVVRHEEHHAKTGEESEPWGRAVGAYVRALNDDKQVESALAEIDAARDEIACTRCFHDWQGNLEEKRGALDAAIKHYVQFTSAIDIFALPWNKDTEAIALFKLGSLYEERGDTDEAIAAYTRMAERWKDADAVLQPQVAEARRRIETLLDRKAQEG